MAKIENVDYEKLPGYAKQVRTKGEELTKKVGETYKEVEAMSKSWYGTRYNELVKAFNGMKASLASMQELIQTSIPVAMETVANNYSMADKGSKVVSVNNTKPRVIPDIPQNKTPGMRFMTESVQQSKTKVSNNFKQMKDIIAQAEAVINSAPWKSQAEASFKANFKTLKNKLNTQFDQIMKDFNSSMTATINDIQSAENSNTVK